MQEGAGALAHSSLFGGFAFWPENLSWSFQFIRLVSTAPVGGADFTEVFHAVREVRSGDHEHWYRQLSDLASRLEAAADAAVADGHPISAREKYFRASNYYRAAGFFYDMDDERHHTVMDGRIRAFHAAAALADPPITPVEIPYEGGTTLPGYLVAPPAGTADPAPAAIVFGGGDAIAEEMYFHIGRALAARGFVVLLVDGPGMGQALRRGIHARHDWEVPTAASVDFLLEQAGVDPDRIAIIAESLGGYYALRGAAFEPRIAACVSWGAFYSFPLVLLTPTEPGGPLPADGRPARRLISLTGAEDAEGARAILERFTAAGVADKITCPTLLLIGGRESGFLRKEGDGVVEPPPPSYQILEELGTEHKQLIVYPEDTPGCTHCQADSMVQAHHDICDWLETVFRR